MTSPEKGNSRRRMIFCAALYALLLLAVLLIANLGKINHWLGEVFSLFRPILWGLALAYLLNPFFRFYERKLLLRARPKAVRRAFALILTYLTLLLILALLVALILPQLYSSMMKFVSNYDSYVISAVNQFNGFLAKMNDWLAGFDIKQDIIHPLEAENLKLSALVLNMDKIMAWAQKIFSSDGSLSVIDLVSNFVSGATDALFAFFVSLYLLLSKEKRYAQIMKVRRALFSNRANAYITRFCTVADRAFGGFIEGKLLDSLIIGILTYIVVAIFRIPYPVLVAAIVGVTNIIPFVGPIIGAIPTSLIILLTDPGKVIPFLIIVVVIQQIDGNLIGPKILGSNTGISSLCVLVAITTMGALWGFVGMLLGVPLFAVVIELVSDDMERRLRSKGYSATTENYYPAGSLLDPTKDVQHGTDYLVKQFERLVLRIQKREERGEELRRRDKIQMSLYRFCRKWHIIREMSDDLLTQFTAEEAVHAADEEAARLIKEARGTDLLERPTQK